MDSLDGDSQIDRISRIHENLLRRQMKSQQQPVRPGTTKPYSRGTKTERGLLDTKSSNRRSTSTTKDKNVNEFIDFLTPRLANKVYLSWMRGLRSYEKYAKPKQPPQATTRAEPFGFSEKYVTKFMEKERKEVRDYKTSHTSDVTHFIKERRTPSNSTQLYFESSLRGYRPRSKTPVEDDELNISSPTKISSEVAARRYKRPAQPKLFNLATTKLRENWGIDKYPQFLPPRIPKLKERFNYTPGVIKRKSSTMVKSNSPHSKTQLVSALQVWFIVREQSSVNKRVKLNHINMNLARDIMSSTSHSPAGVSWALSLRGDQKFL